MITSLALTLVLSSAAGSVGDVHRVALVVGMNDGGPDRLTLRYADDDARSFAAVLTELGGVAREDAVLLLEPTMQDAARGLEDVAARLASARRRGDRPEVIVYYSGHSDGEALLLGEERWSYADLRRAIDALAADVRVVVLDSCSSGSFTRAKGGVRRPAFLKDGASSVRGHAFLTSSSADESAQESDAIGASFFTHSLVSGLRGGADANGDARVSLTEAYQYAFHETLARTERTTLGGQHPAYAIELAGTGDFIISDLSKSDATLVLSPDAVGRYSIRDADDRLVAEVKKLPGGATSLALPAGRYRALVDRSGERFAVEVELAPGAREVLDEAALLRVTGEPVRARGPSPEEVAAREAERVRVAERAFARERLTVKPPGAGVPLFSPPRSFEAFVGDVDIPLEYGDFYDRAERPDLRAEYDSAIERNTWMTYGGLTSEILFLGVVAAIGVTIMLMPPVVPELVAMGVVGGFVGGLLLSLVSGSVALFGVLLNPNPIELDEAREVAAAKNAALRKRFELPAEPQTETP